MLLLVYSIFGQVYFTIEVDVLSRERLLRNGCGLPHCWVSSSRPLDLAPIAQFRLMAICALEQSVIGLEPEDSTLSMKMIVLLLELTMVAFLRVIFKRDRLKI